MSATQSAILTNEARYTINDDAGRRYTFQTDVSDFRGKTYYHVWTYRGARKQYVGKLNTFTLQVETTAKSSLPANDYSLTLLNKLLARVAADDHLSYQTKGYDINLTNGSKPKVTVAQLQEMVPVAAEQEEGEEDTEPDAQPIPTPHQNGIGREARTAAVQVNRITNGLDADERKANLMNNVANELSGDLFSIEYDIPETCEKVQNPSGWLWRFACRTTNSVWVMTTKGYEAPQVRSFLELCRAYGVKLRIRRTHPDDVQAERDEIRNAMAKHIQQVHSSLIERIASASERLNLMTATIDRILANDLDGIEKKQLDAANKLIETAGVRYAKDAATKGKDNQVRALLKAIGEDLNQSIACAKQFDETENMASLFAAARSALDAERATFNERMRSTGGRRA